MGFDKTSLEACLLSQKYVSKKNKSLCLGRQQIHINSNDVKYYLEKYNFKALNQYSMYDYFEPLFRGLGYDITDSMDNSTYEHASIIHNLNNPLVDTDKKYNYIYDSGTTEHIFNVPQVFENIINLLEGH